MTYRSHPAPRYAGVGSINAASLMTSAVKWAIEVGKTDQTAASDRGNQLAGLPRDQRGRRTVPRLTHR